MENVVHFIGDDECETFLRSLKSGRSSGLRWRRCMDELSTHIDGSRKYVFLLSNYTISRYLGPCRRDFIFFLFIFSFSSVDIVCSLFTWTHSSIKLVFLPKYFLIRCPYPVVVAIWIHMCACLSKVFSEMNLQRHVMDGGIREKNLRTRWKGLPLSLFLSHRTGKLFSQRSFQLFANYLVRIMWAFSSILISKIFSWYTFQLEVEWNEFLSLRIIRKRPKKISPELSLIVHTKCRPYLHCCPRSFKTTQKSFTKINSFGFRFNATRMLNYSDVNWWHIIVVPPYSAIQLGS